MLQKLNWMLISEIENEITNVLFRSDFYGEFVCHFVKLVALSTKLSARKPIWSIENEVEFLKMKLSERKRNRMPENEITCIFFEIDTGMSTSNQFRCEIERPFTNLNEISTKLAGKTYTKNKFVISEMGHIIIIIIISEQGVSYSLYRFQ